MVGAKRHQLPFPGSQITDVAVEEDDGFAVAHLPIRERGAVDGSCLYGIKGLSRDAGV